MSMSTHVVGFVPPDDKWKKMKAIWDSCVEAAIEVPEEVELFFQGEAPDDNGREIDLTEKTYGGTVAKEWGDDYRSGYELKLEDIPENVKVIRFFCM